MNSPLPFWVAVWPVVFVLIFAPACNQADLSQELISLEEQAVFVHQTSESDLHYEIELLAKALSLNLESLEFRRMLKSLAMEQFDGDYDILLSSIFDIQEFASEVHFAYASKNNISLIEAESHLNLLIAQYPLLNVSVPIFCETWDVTEFVPPVAPIPQGIEEDNAIPILGYYSDGRVDTFSVLFPPDHTVIAIGLNERGGRPITDTGIEEENSVTRGARVDGASLGLWQINIPNLNQIEPWVNGKPEFRLRLFGSSAGSQVWDSGEPAGKFKPTRSLVDDPATWYVMDIGILPSWTFSNQGNTMTMHWIEEDGGNSITTISQTFVSVDDNGNTSTSTYSFDIRSNDDNMGFASINNSDQTWAIYETASIRWYMK